MPTNPSRTPKSRIGNLRKAPRQHLIFTAPESLSAVSVNCLPTLSKASITSLSIQIRTLPDCVVACAAFTLRFKREKSLPLFNKFLPALLATNHCHLNRCVYLNIRDEGLSSSLSESRAPAPGFLRLAGRAGSSWGDGFAEAGTCVVVPHLLQ